MVPAKLSNHLAISGISYPIAAKPCGWFDIIDSFMHALTGLRMKIEKKLLVWVNFDWFLGIGRSPTVMDVGNGSSKALVEVRDRDCRLHEGRKLSLR